MIAAAGVAGYYLYTRYYNAPAPKMVPIVTPKVQDQSQAGQSEPPPQVQVQNAASPGGEKFYGVRGVELMTQGPQLKNMTSGPFFGPMRRGAM